MLFLLLVTVAVFFKCSYSVDQNQIGFTRHSFYERGEAYKIATKNDDIPVNLREFFSFDGSTLLVSPSRPIEFIVARKDPYDKFIVQWRAPSAQEYNKCSEIFTVCHSAGKPNLNNSLQAKMRRNCYITESSVELERNNSVTRDPDGGDPLPNDPFLLYQFDTNTTTGATHVSFNKNGTWEDGHIGWYLNGLRTDSLPDTIGHYQSGRLVHGPFCNEPFLLPETGLVFQKAIRKIGKIKKYLDGSLVADGSNPDQIEDNVIGMISFSLIDYLFILVFGTVSSVMALPSLISFVASFIFRYKRKQTRDSHPSFSLEASFVEPVSSSSNSTSESALSSSAE